VVALKEEKKKQMAAMEELRREVDVFINSFLKQEGLEDDKKEMLRELLDEVKALNEELVSVLPLTRTLTRTPTQPQP
jgi:hypothetical protein